MRRHGLHHVGDGQYFGAEQNFIALESSRIARAVNALMVLPDKLGNWPWEIDALEDVIARLAVLLQHLVFQLRQASGL